MAIIDKVGRKPILIVSSIVMLISMIIPAIIVAKFSHDWPGHPVEGWVAVAFIWLYVSTLPPCYHPTYRC